MAARKPPGTGRPKPPPARTGPPRTSNRAKPGPKSKPKPPGPAASFPDRPAAEPPAYLDNIPGAHEHYTRLVELLADRYRPHYTDGLAILAKSYAILDLWAADVARNPSTPTREGGEKMNPATKLVMDAQQTIRSYEKRYGLTPKDEKAIEAQPATEPTRPGDPAIIGAM